MINKIVNVILTVFLILTVIPAIPFIGVMFIWAMYDTRRRDL